MFFYIFVEMHLCTTAGKPHDKCQAGHMMIECNADHRHCWLLFKHRQGDGCMVPGMPTAWDNWHKLLPFSSFG